MQRFTTTMMHGLTCCYWDGVEVAAIRLSMFPDMHELDGFDVRLCANLSKAIAGRVPKIVSCFDEEEDAIEAVRHACIVGFVRPNAPPVEPERTPLRPRDDHRTMT